MPSISYRSTSRRQPRNACPCTGFCSAAPDTPPLRRATGHAPAHFLDTAQATASCLGGDRNAWWTAFGPTNVILFQISAAYALGDAGAAIEYARRVPLAAIPVPDRHSRFWVDVARAWHQWGKPAECYSALLAAERAVPEEVLGRPAVRRLAADLLTAPRRAGMDGVGAFAARVGAAPAT
jgi:hypothetical protein